jgi:uncharacterized protein
MDTFSNPRARNVKLKATRMMLALLKVVVVVAVVFLALACACQRKLVFPAGREVWRTPASDPFRWAYEEVDLPVGKYTTNAWFIQVQDARGVVLFSHGNAGTIAGRLESVQVFRDLGFSVLLYDYGGYGKSTGKPSEKRCYADIRAMWEYLTVAQGFAPEQVVLFGRSLGGGVAAQLATEVSPRAVILESTFESIASVAKGMFPFLPVKPLIRYRFDTAEKIGRIHAPLLVIHSPDDTIIPYRHGEALFQAANEPKRFLEIRGDHNEGFVVSLEAYQRGLEEFLGVVFR